jgi:hypothetical protein
VLVFEKLGVGVLRRAWVNLDLIWAGALITTGAVTLMILGGISRSHSEWR